MDTETAPAPHEVRLAYSVDDVVRVSGLGRSKVYEEINSGCLVARKAGKRTLVLAADLDAWLNGLPKMEAGYAVTA